MATFEGWLIKCGNTEFPLKYIKAETYKSTDNQRTEIKAYRDANNLLHRQTSKNFKTKIEFETCSLSLAELSEIQALLSSNFIDSTQRKMVVSYWNNENLTYKKATVYVPDIDYTIKAIKGNDIKYNGIRIAFIQY